MLKDEEQRRDLTYIANQDTIPLPVETIQSVAAFRTYLQRYGLEPLSVAVASHVRYLTIWNMLQGKPISREQAAKVCQGLLNLTGVPYTAPVLVYPQETESLKQMSTTKSTRPQTGSQTRNQ